ncbi:MAG: phytoene desaturase [Alphaproteobacteria bacterium]|nr:phytoene desaturase [Alphaproteobacteria bacterium]
MPDASMSPRPHAVVIGAGVGGLAAAIRLGARGYAVTVLDKLDKPGGRAYVFEQDGFQFDAGPTIITAPYLFEELWTLCGKRMADHVTLVPMDPFYKIRFDDGRVFTYRGDMEAMREEVARFEPNDVAGFDRFMKASERIYQTAFEKLADQPFNSLRFTAGELVEMVRLGGHRSVYATVSKYLSHPLLRLTFSFHPLLIGGNPFSATAYYCLIAHLEKKHGVHFAMGGTGALVRGMADLIEGQGNRVRYGVEVERIEVEDGRAAGVRLADGERVAADLVISNADSAWTYGKLLADAPRKRWSDAKLSRASYSMGLFVWYFGTNRRFDDVDHHTMVMGPRYRELLRDIFERKHLAEDFSLYLHRPTATDPSLAPAGGDAFYALVPVPNLQSGTDWTVEGERFRARVQKRLEETMLPGLGEAIVSSRIMTPLDFQDRLLSVEGAGFSLEPKLFQSAWFRPHNLSEEVENLYLVGAGTHPGAGLPGVLCSARVLDRVIPGLAETGAEAGGEAPAHA